MKQKASLKAAWEGPRHSSVRWVEEGARKHRKKVLKEVLSSPNIKKATYYVPGRTSFHSPAVFLSYASQHTKRIWLWEHFRSNFSSKGLGAVVSVHTRERLLCSDLSKWIVPRGKTNLSQTGLNNEGLTTSCGHMMSKTILLLRLWDVAESSESK